MSWYVFEMSNCSARARRAEEKKECSQKDLMRERIYIIYISIHLYISHCLYIYTYSICIRVSKYIFHYLSIHLTIYVTIYQGGAFFKIFPPINIVIKVGYIPSLYCQRQCFSAGRLPLAHTQVKCVRRRINSVTLDEAGC